MIGILDFLRWHENSDQYIATLVLLLCTVAVRRLFLMSVQTASIPPEQKRKFMVLARNVALLVVFLGLFVVWGRELRSVAISVVAVLAAFVLATRELITCLTGAILKIGSNSFRIGDRIEVGGLRGEVIDHNLLTTTLLEIGPGQSFHQRTGRRLVLPNSLLLSNAVLNETFTNEYVLHVFSVKIDAKRDWRAIETTLLESATEACADYIEDAHLKMEEVGRREGLDSSSAAPKITLQVSEPDRLKMLVRLAVPAMRRGQIEQEVLRSFADKHWGSATPDQPVQ